MLLGLAPMRVQAGALYRDSWRYQRIIPAGVQQPNAARRHPSLRVMQMTEPKDTFYQFEFDNGQKMRGVLKELLERLRKLKNTKAEVYRSKRVNDHEVYLNHSAFWFCTGMPELPQWRRKCSRKALDGALIGPLVKLFPEAT